jgi:putative membrane protein
MKQIFFFTGCLPVAIFYFTGCMHRPVDQSLRRWDHMMGYGGLEMMLIWLVAIIAAVLVVYFVFSRRNDKDMPESSRMGETPLEILKKRYARGEISKEEFDRIKEDIESL